MSVIPRDLLAVGKIVKAFGVRGDLIVSPMTDNPARFRRLTAVFIGPDDGQVEPYRVRRAAVEQRGVKISLEDVPDRNAAETLVGRLVFVDAADREPLPKGRYYVHELIGLRVVDEARGPVGTVADVIKLPAHDLYVVDAGGRECMIPAVKEFIRKIDIHDGTMTVRLIDGLVDDASAETVRED